MAVQSDKDSGEAAHHNDGNGTSAGSPMELLGTLHSLRRALRRAAFFAAPLRGSAPGTSAVPSPSAPAIASANVPKPKPEARPALDERASFTPATAKAPAAREPGTRPPHRPSPAASLPADPPATAALAAAAADLEELAASVSICRACGLCQTRTQTVFADGSPRAKIFFVGEAPGADEDRLGRPFVGRAGQLLTKIIEAGMGLSRERDVYIANVLKCRPPENREPQADEKRLCTPYLERQIEEVNPDMLIALGRHAAGYLLSSEASMASLRGQVHQRHGRKLVVTYHPSFLLRSPHMKKETWLDIQMALRSLGLPVPGAPLAAAKEPPGGEAPQDPMA